MNNSIWQLCPVCNGSGIDPHICLLNTINPPCKLCKGKLIISTITGKPPVKTSSSEK